MDSPSSSPHLLHATLHDAGGISDDEMGPLDDYSHDSNRDSPSSPSQLDHDQEIPKQEDFTGKQLPLEDGHMPDDPKSKVLPRDKQRKTTYYDYATEKQMSHTEAKLFYQTKHRDPHTGLGDHGSPRIRAKTFPVNSGGDFERLSRTGSIKSLQSNRSHIENYGAHSPNLSRGQTDSPSASPQFAALERVNQHSLEQTYQRPKHLGHADTFGGEHSLTSDALHESNDLPVEAERDGGFNEGAGDRGLQDNYFRSDPQITSELSAIYANVQKVLEIRHKYIRLSLQGQGDNPKDEPSWPIYPPPPRPVWDEDKERPTVQQRATPGPVESQTVCSKCSKVLDGQSGTSKSVSQKLSTAHGSQYTNRTRKAGQNIGEDFEMSDLFPLPDATDMTFQLDEAGVYQVFENVKAAEADNPILHVPTIREFYMDLDFLLNVSSDGPSKSFAFRRLKYLEGRFNLYALLNEYQEIADSKRVPHRDFYNVRKVDTHVHHSACMNQKHLLRFIKSKMKRCPDEVVLYRDGKYLTLKEVFESLNLTAYDLSIDTLDMHVC